MVLRCASPGRVGPLPAVVLMSTALSPEWDRWFDEEFTDLVSRDEDLVRSEFDALIDAAWHTPPPADPPAPLAPPGSAPTVCEPADEFPAVPPGPTGDVRDGRTPDAPADGQRSPPA